MTEFDQLSKMTVVVADTGDLEAIKKYQPVDSTTNPSLVLKALNLIKSDENEYNKLLDLAINYGKKQVPECKTDSDKQKLLNVAIDRLAVEFGLRILGVIPGYVSTELDARLSFDINQSVERAINIIKMYEEFGISNAKDRVLIKVASTWEGFEIAKILREKYAIKCNMTLLFSIYQAAAAAQVSKAFLISPFVGRITDWYKKEEKVDSYDAYKDDPGVDSVRNIYYYYKDVIKTDTIVMGASFRNKQQILALAGCDRLTIAPKFLKELKESKDNIKKLLYPNNDDFKSKAKYNTKIEITQSIFRYGMCYDPMATEKLAQGIRGFANDIIKLQKILESRL